MSQIPFEEHKRFIDALVKIAKAPSATTSSIKIGDNVFSERPDSEQQRKETIVASLSPKQKEAVVELLLDEHFKVIEETLIFLKSNKYRISYDNIPFDEDLLSDFRARLDGSTGPDKDSSSQ